MRNFLAEPAEAARRLRRPAAFSLIATGFGAGVAQVLLFRELLVVCHGNEISLALMLAGWLLYGALGSTLARHGARRDAFILDSARRAARLAPLTVPALLVSMILLRSAPQWLAYLANRVIGIVGTASVHGAHLRTLISLQPGEMLGLIHICAVVVAATLLPAMLAGAQFAANCGLLARVRRGDAGAVGAAYALDAVGHLIGGVLLAWTVLQWLDPFRTAAATGVAGLAATAWLATSTRARRRAMPIIAVLIALAAQTALLLVARPLDDWTLRRFRWAGREVLASGNSVYGNIAILRQGTNGVALFENGTPSGESPALPQVQVSVQFAMLQVPAPRQVLMIGGGALGGLQEALKHSPARIDYVEMDPLIFDLAAGWLTGADAAALRDRRVHRITDDGRLWVKRTRAAGLRPYDVVIVSVPEPMTAQMNRFFTTDFFREVRDVLRPGGVVAWQMPASGFYMGPQLLKLDACLWHTAGSVFPYMALTAGETLCVVASPDRAFLISDLQAIRRRLAWETLDIPVFEAQIPDLLDPYNVQYIRKQLKAARGVPQNTDFHPVGYFYDQAVWVAKFHPSTLSFFDRLEKLSYGRLLRIVFGVGVALLLLGLARPVRAVFTPLAVLVSGFVGMLLEVALLMAYQAQYGAVYSQVGIIIGAFMVGLAAGGVTFGRYLNRLSRPQAAAWALVAVQAGIGAIAAVLPVVLSAMWSSAGASGLGMSAARAAFPAMTALVGFGVGAQFPLASWVAAWGKWSVGRAATALYALDLIGAAIGACVAGTALVPVLGIGRTCELAAWVSIAVAVLLASRAVRFPD
jgi:spermidine synthase